MLSLFLDSSTTNTADPASAWTQWVIVIVVAVLLVGWLVWTSIRGKKKQQEAEKEAQELIDSVKPGNKVKTIGGVCGIVVEVDNEENTFVLETGSESAGKCYMKFDKQAIYQTDAVAKSKAESKAENAEPALPEEPEAATEAAEPAAGQSEEKAEKE